MIVSCMMMMSCEAFCLCEFCQSEQLDVSTRGMQKFHFDLRTGLWLKAQEHFAAQEKRTECQVDCVGCSPFHMVAEQVRCA